MLGDRARADVEVLGQALHRLDFGPLNQRPLWDIVTLPLILGVCLLCVVGLWLGVKRLRRSFAKRPSRAG